MTKELGGSAASKVRLGNFRARGPRVSDGPALHVREQRLPRFANTFPPASTTYATILPREIFLAQLHREKRRADRSKAPLSLVSYKVLEPDCGASLPRLLEVLAALARETDMIGQLSANEVAVICPETGEDGVLRFMQKVTDGAAGLPHNAECATYPDRLFERDATHSEPDSPSAGWVLDDPRGRSDSGSYALKRALDVLGASLALVLLSPLLLMTALAVKFSSPGPIIFSQIRLGKRGSPFRFYKFRSMYVNGDDGIHREFVRRLIQGEHHKVNQPDGATPLYKLKADPRVTRVGRIIRKTSIDELPQLINVLKGDLSLVGPRPPLPYEVQSYRSWHVRRVLEAKPGITGLWQVEGRSRVSFDEMVRLDLRYARNCSLGLDLGILLRTVRVVLRCEGAK